MTAAEYAAPLIVDIRPSRTLRLIITMAAIATALVLLTLPWPFYAIAALQGPVLYLGYRAYRRHAALSTSFSVLRVVWDAQDRWWLTAGDGSEIEARLLHDSYVSQALVVLNFRDVATHRRTSVLLLRDNADVDLLRKLRVRLRITRDATSVRGD